MLTKFKSTRRESYHLKLSEYFYHIVQSHLLICVADETETQVHNNLIRNFPDFGSKKQRIFKIGQQTIDVKDDMMN